MLIAGTPEFIYFTLVIMRMSGAILLNPIFTRRNIPSLFKAALILMVSVIVYSASEVPSIEAPNTIVYGVLLLKELAVGFILGFVMQLFELIVTIAGTTMDFQMGLSMASVYDAQNGTQVALTGNILQIYFWLLFFAVDGHLALFKIIMTSHDIAPYGNLVIGPDAVDAVLIIFIESVALGVRLAFPIIAFEFIMEIGIGLLMRMIPQINLFVLSIQLRVIVGILMLVILISPIGSYLQSYISEMMNTLQDVLTTLI